MKRGTRNNKRELLIPEHPLQEAIDALPLPYVMRDGSSYALNKHGAKLRTDGYRVAQFGNTITQPLLNNLIRHVNREHATGGVGDALDHYWAMLQIAVGDYESLDEMDF